MIRVTVLYPSGDGHTFDTDYYLKTHIPLFQKAMGSAMKDIRIEQGISGGTPGLTPPFVMIVNATFESANAFETAFAPHAAEIQGDIKNYTNIQPILQISEVKG